jgi:hypothetical protein
MSFCMNTGFSPGIFSPQLLGDEMTRRAEIDSYEVANKNEYDLLIKTLTNRANYKIDLIEHGKRITEGDKTTFAPTNFILRKWRFDWSRGLSVANISIPLDEAEDLIKVMYDVINGAREQISADTTNPIVRAA